MCVLFGFPRFANFPFLLAVHFASDTLDGNALLPFFPLLCKVILLDFSFAGNAFCLFSSSLLSYPFGFLLLR